MKYDVEAIRKKVNNMIANLKKACAAEDWETVESILCSSTYADEEDIPRVKQEYQVILKRTLTKTIYVEAEDEDDAIVQAEAEHVGRHCNMNEWDFEDAPDPDVELVKED